MNEILSGLFARQAFTANFLQRSFSETSTWIELGGALALMALTFWLAQWLGARYKARRVHFPLLHHIGRRILWPVLMLLAGGAALFAANQYFGYSAVWLQLLVLAARWMILIRVAVAIVHAALPQNRISDWLERAVSWALWIGFVLWVSELDETITDFMKGIQFNIGSAKLNLFSVSTGLLWVGILMIGALWLARFIGDRLKRSRLDANLSIILSKIITSALVVLAVLIGLPMVGIDLTVLSVFGGALGVGVGFGLQKVASNYISGFIILGDRSIRMNDRLTVNNFTGNVIKITSRFVVLRGSNGTEALIPNETFMTSTVVNESYTDRTLQQSFPVQVAYQTDLNEALAVLTAAAAAQARVAANPAPMATVTDFASDGINLSLSYWVGDPENGLGGLKSDIMLEIWRQFNAHGIEFPYPQRDVRIVNAAAGAEEKRPSENAADTVGHA
ncbi:mechanosensitive ion channel family protein [Neisseria perflava]|uniref:mechanosensitive ion channel family protein n=1 Tax=Neisseria perflava TaxID=33053 RepID=UPI0020A143B0|nr:mechanosensitive ion channel domain-containing protein [Neisseria perflava]MCP1659476.1 small-conductance mechanosensitive channel [Neisseria perflava]